MTKDQKKIKADYDAKGDHSFAAYLWMIMKIAWADMLPELYGFLLFVVLLSIYLAVRG